MYELAAQRSQHKANEQGLQVEIDKIAARPDSNIPGHYHDFRAQLAEVLGVDDQYLPFVAELVEVKAEERAWRGAVERALGGQRLRLLIPPERMQTALSWVVRRDNHLHVRLLEAKTPHETPHFHADGFSRKLNFKVHSLREPLKAFLATLDRHCVDSAQQLRQTPNGMTIQGLISGSSGRFEKQDQQPLNRGWMTGFDNLADISNEVTIIEERIADLNSTMQRVDFQIGRFLQLRPQRIRHKSLRTLESAQRHLRSAALQGDESGEQHYQALAEVIELLRQASDNKRTVGARALLDPRYRLQFSVAVIDRQSNDTLEIRTGSQGGSGGEKEIELYQRLLRETNNRLEQEFLPVERVKAAIEKWFFHCGE